MNKITAKELASMLDGREWFQEITESEEQLAKENRLVILRGDRYPVLRMKGSIKDRISTIDIEYLILNRNGISGFLWEDGDLYHVDFCKMYAKQAGHEIIRIVDQPYNGIEWEFKTDIHHEVFSSRGDDTILNCGDDTIFCAGIVFSIDDLPNSLEDELACLAEYRAICTDPATFKAELEALRETKEKNNV